MKNANAFNSLEEVVSDALYPEVDLALRRGRHIGRDDGALYELCVDGQVFLEALYQRFGCELVHRSDGYFYLVPTSERLGRKQLSAGEMLVGQTLALLYLDPSTLQSGGVVSREVVLPRLTGLVGAEALVRTLNPRKRRYDERVAAELARKDIEVAVRTLAQLGFVDVGGTIPEGHLRLRPALMRFAEPVRGLGDTARALEQLIARGEVVTQAQATADDEDEVDA